MGGSVIRRRQLARELRQLREAAGYSLEVAAVRLEWSTSKLSRIENGMQSIDIHSVRGMLDLYDLGGGRAAYIQDLTRAARQRGWWKAYGVDDLGYVPLEAEASLVRQFTLAYVPGLLQTADYARAVMATSTLSRSAEVLQNDLAVRVHRQRRLTSDEEPLELVALLDESVLLRPVGGPAVMRAQMEHVLIAAELPTVTVLVVPFRFGAHQGLDGPFSILSFGDLGEPDLAYAEHALGATQVDKETEVARVTLAFDRLRSAALSPAESVELVSEVLDRA
jgi:transcriptional regulator with XRE-family HTH domain